MIFVGHHGDVFCNTVIDQKSIDRSCCVMYIAILYNELEHNSHNDDK